MKNVDYTGTDSTYRVVDELLPNPGINQLQHAAFFCDSLKVVSNATGKAIDYQVHVPDTLASGICGKAIALVIEVPKVTGGVKVSYNYVTRDVSHYRYVHKLIRKTSESDLRNSYYDHIKLKLMNYQNGAGKSLEDGLRNILMLLQNTAFKNDVLSTQLMSHVVDRTLTDGSTTIDTFNKLYNEVLFRGIKDVRKLKLVKILDDLVTVLLPDTGDDYSYYVTKGPIVVFLTYLDRSGDIITGSIPLQNGSIILRMFGVNIVVPKIDERSAMSKLSNRLHTIVSGMYPKPKGVKSAIFTSAVKILTTLGGDRVVGITSLPENTDSFITGANVHGKMATHYTKDVLVNLSGVNQQMYAGETLVTDDGHLVYRIAVNDALRDERNALYTLDMGKKLDTPIIPKLQALIAAKSNTADTLTFNGVIDNTFTGAVGIWVAVTTETIKVCDDIIQLTEKDILIIHSASTYSILPIGSDVKYLTNKLPRNTHHTILTLAEHRVGSVVDQLILKGAVYTDALFNTFSTTYGVLCVSNVLDMMVFGDIGVVANGVTTNNSYGTGI